MNRWIRRLLYVVGGLVIVAGLILQARPGPGIPAPPRDCHYDPAGVPPPSGPEGEPANYLHTCGNRLFDATGREVRIAGISWFGMETGTYAPHGLWARNWRELLDHVAALGYNTIRVPFSNEALEPGREVSGVNYLLNPDLQGRTPVELLDKLVAGARERGLKIILDRHRPTAAGQSSLWYTEEVPEERWLADWRMLAARYLGNDTVIGVDLHNEPRDAATWGTDDPATDWRLAAERAGDAVLEVNPHLLILVQGVERYNGDWYWWGGDLRGVREAPVRLRVPNRVVYSPHEYGPGVFEQGWFQDPRFPENLPGEWDRRWGYIHRSGLAPVVLGEFGGRSVGNDRDGQWQQSLLTYLRRYQIGALTWALNPNSGDTGGIFDEDWRSVLQEKQQAYEQVLAPPISNGAGNGFRQAPARATVRFRQSETALETGNVGFAFHILNDGPAPLDLSRLEVRYWFTADHAGEKAQRAVIDWAAVGEGHVLADFVSTDRGGQDHYLRIRFDGNAGAISPYQTGGEVHVRFHRSDWSSYQQSNDYSFAGASGPQEQPGEWDRVTLYLDGKLIWGREP